MKISNASVSSEPTANIAISRNRIKHYGNQVYLKHGTNFEIELFNPKGAKVLAKISINGRQISEAGIVLRPGERVFLERWIDSSEKFLFETYEVESTEESKKAIEKNGLVRVEFYDQQATFTNVLTTYGTTTDWRPTLTLGGTTANYCTVFTSNSALCGSISSVSGTTNAASLNCVVAGSLETGMVEKGEVSSQSLTYDNSFFSFLRSSQVEIKILPESAKPIEITEIRNYCHGCGTRVKSSSWKFCPSCGLELE